MSNLRGALATGVALFLGCGGGSGSSGAGNFTPAVSGSKPLNMLTSADKLTLCADVMVYFQSAAVRRQECKFVGVLSAGLVATFDATMTDAQLQTTCSQAINQCVSSGTDGGIGTPMTGMCDTSQSVPASCTAPVAEYAACVSTLPDALGGAAPECSSITRASLNPDGGTLDPGSISPYGSAACITLSNHCPGIFDSSNGVDGGAH